MAVAAARDVVSPALHGQLRGLVQSGNFRARLLSADRFQLETALCSERLTWQVAFSLVNGCYVPDILFATDWSPLWSSQYPVAPLLRTWHGDHDGSALTELMTAVLHSYGHTLRTRLKQAVGRDARLRFELETLPAGGDAILVHEAEGRAAGSSRAVFVARLSGADLAPARQLLERLWGSQALAASVLAEQTQLKVVYAVHAHGRSSTEPVERDLHLPEQLQAAVGATLIQLGLCAGNELALSSLASNIGKPILPAWSGGMCIMEYTPLVAAALTKHCGAVAAAWQLRQELLTALPETGLLRTLEADSITFRSASYRLEMDDLELLVSVDLPLSFPGTAPSLTMQPTGMVAQRFESEQLPWSKHWSAMEMAEHTVGFLHEQVSLLLGSDDDA